MKPQSKWCTSRHYDPDVTCELPRHGDERWHKAEYGEPVPDADGKLVAQVVSWA